MSSEDADESSVGDSSFEEEVPIKTLPLSPFFAGTNDPFSVVLKGGSPWGFKLRGGSEAKSPIQIAELEAGSKAETSGELHVGDYVLSVNDVRCTSHTEALQLVHSAFRTLTLLIWRGTTEPLSTPVRSQSFLGPRKARELQDRAQDRARQQQSGIQDDSAVFNESKSSNTFRMKPRQRRIESFHGRRQPHHSGSSQVGTSSTSNLPPQRRLPSPHGDPASLAPPTTSADAATKLALKGWATEHDLTTRTPPVIMSAGRSGSAQGRHTPLTPAKSTPVLNQDEPPLKSPRGYSPIQYNPMAMTKSTTDISDSSGHMPFASPTSPKSPTWYQQRFPNRANIFDFPVPVAAVRRGAGSPRNSIASYSSSSSMSNYPPPPPSSGYQSQGFASLSPSSMGVNSMYSQSPATSGVYSPAQSQSSLHSQQQSYQHQGPGVGTSSYMYDDTPSKSSTSAKNYGRRSLPPQTLHQFRQEFPKENMQPEPQRPRKSMPVTQEEDDPEIPDIKPQPPNDLDLRPMYSPPAPPVRDISSLKYVGYSQNHEKYPSWPVSSGNIPPNFKDVPADRNDQGQSQQGQGQIQGQQEEQVELSATGRFEPLEGSAKAGPGLERKSSDEMKQPRNQSDPGFKQKPKKSFYTTKKPPVVAAQPRDYENTKSVEERFEEFCNHSKPGYPPPKLDPDGHNYGDEKYSIPSPPERDMPNLDEKTLVQKIAAVISPQSQSSQLQQYNVEHGGGDMNGPKTDTATSPVQSPTGARRMPGSYFQQAMNAKNLLNPNTSASNNMVDSGTSPIGSPMEDKSGFNFRTITADPNAYSRSERSNEKRGLIIRQMPYYNTSTQTDDVNQYSGSAQANRRSAEMKDGRTHFSEKSIQAQMSRSSMSSDSDSNNRYSDNDRGSGRMRKPLSPTTQQNYPVSTSTPRSESSTQNGSSIMFSDNSNAPLLRKLSEEFYRGKIPGSFPNTEKRNSSASNMDELRSPRSEASYSTGLKEAGSYSSVVIHPHDNTMPFGRDDFGSYPSLTSSKQDLPRSEREAVADRSSKLQFGMSSSAYIHRPTASMSTMPPRSLQESRFTSDSNLSSENFTVPKTYGGSMMQLPSSRTSRTESNQSQTYVYSSSGSSVSSHPRGSMEARSSGSRIGSDSSTSGISSAKSAQNVRRDSDKDSVFYDKSSPLVVEEERSEGGAAGSQLDKKVPSDETRKTTGVGRKESMKMAYGVFDEHEGHYATPYGHQRNSSEVLSSSSSSSHDPNTHASENHGRSASFTDYMPMHGNNDRLDQIKEESSEAQWMLSVQKAQSLSKEQNSNYMNVSINQGQVNIQGTTKDDSSTDKGSSVGGRSRMKRSSSEQIRPHKLNIDKKRQEADLRTSKGKIPMETSSGAESSSSNKGNKSDSDSATGPVTLPQQLSDSDLKKMQQKAVMDFVERKTKTSGTDSSEPTSPVPREANTELSSPDKPVSSSSMILNLTQKYNYTKAQRTESLRRTRSISSNSSRDSSDYVEMRRNNQTEWSKLRAIRGESPRRPLSIGSDISGIDNFALSGVSSVSTPEGDSQHVRSASDIPNRERGIPTSEENSAPSNSNVTMVTAPIYQNLDEYPRRPPPPIPKGPSGAGSGVNQEVQPPALPPRIHKFVSSKSESALLARLDAKQLHDLQVSQGQRSEGSPQDQSQGLWDGSPLNDSYADQLRKQARRFSEQLKPTPMSIQSTKNPMHIAYSRSYKQEPDKAVEAIPAAAKLSPTTTQTETSSSSMMELSPPHSQSLRNLSRSPGPPPLPTPLKNGDKEYKIEMNEPYPSPPPGMMDSDKDGVSSEDGAEGSQRCADDSYGSYKNKSHRQVGQYKRTVSDSNVLRGLPENNKLRPYQETNNNENKELEIPSKPPRRKLEQGRDSPSPVCSSPVTQSKEPQSVSPVPQFHGMAEVSSIHSVTKSVAKPLQSSHTPVSQSGNIVSTVVQRPNAGGSSTSSVSSPQNDQQQDDAQERPSVRDRVKNIEVISYSPVGSKTFPLKSPTLGIVSDSSSKPPQRVVNPAQPASQSRPESSSLENLSNSVLSSNSFSDKLRPVVRKIGDSERSQQEPYVSSGSPQSSVSDLHNDTSKVDSTPPVPVRTYRQLDDTGNVRPGRPDYRHRSGRSGDSSDSSSTYRRDSFQSKAPPPRLYENKVQNSTTDSSNMTHAGHVHEMPKGQGYSMPEPQVPSRSKIEEFGGKKRHYSGEQVSQRPSRSEQGHHMPEPANNLPFEQYNSGSDRKYSSPEPMRPVKSTPPGHNVDTHSGGNRVSHDNVQPTRSEIYNRREKRTSGESELRQENINKDSKGDHSNKRDIRRGHSHREQNARSDQSYRTEQKEENVNRGDNSYRQNSGSPSGHEHNIGRSQRPYPGQDQKHLRSPPANQNNSPSNYSDRTVSPQSQSPANDQHISRNSPKEQIVNKKNDEKDVNTQDNEKSKAGKNVPQKLPTQGLVIHHGRQPSADELECNEKAQELARALPDSDKALSVVLQSDSNKSRMQYMNGLFKVEEPATAPVRPRSASRKDNSAPAEKKEEDEEKKQHSPMPPNYYISSSKAMIELEIRKFGNSSDITKDIGDSDALRKKKEELLQSMMKKVETLKEDKEELQTDIEENEKLSEKLGMVVDEKCKSQQEKDKFRSYIEDMEKIIRLLLKLSGLLARAENAIQSLTDETNEKVKKMTYDKRDRLHQQHEEAKELKANNDRRSEQVLTFLTQVMTPTELEDYHYFIKMKSNYTIQMQEIEDKIGLGNEQISALQKSIPSIRKK